MTDLGTLGGGDVQVAQAVNEEGHIVGASSDASGLLHAFYWTPEAGMFRSAEPPAWPLPRTPQGAPTWTSLANLRARQIPSIRLACLANAGASP